MQFMKKMKKPQSKLYASNMICMTSSQKDQKKAAYNTSRLTESGNIELKLSKGISKKIQVNKKN